MANPFERTWYIVRWNPDDQRYNYLFSNQLDISPEGSNDNISWEDQHDTSYKFPFAAPSPTTTEVYFPVTFPSITPPFTGTMELTVTPTTLTGKIKTTDQEGPTGTFTAEATPPPPPFPTELRHRPWSLFRWLRSLIR